MRCFFSINLPEKIRENVSHFISLLKRKESSISWIPEKNLHITIKFLGNVSKVNVERLIKYSKEISMNDFKVVFSNLGVFPSLNKPRVLWIGVSEGRNELLKLFNSLDEKSYLIGVKKDKREYVPHLTIARCRSGMSNKKILEKNFVSPPFFVKNFSLMKSVFDDNGVHYEKIHSFNL